MNHTFAHYTYSIANKLSLITICIITVLAGSFVITLLAPTPEDADWILKRLAWPVWGSAFVIRAAQWIYRYLRHDT